MRAQVPMATQKTTWKTEFDAICRLTMADVRRLQSHGNPIIREHVVPILRAACERWERGEYFRAKDIETVDTILYYVRSKDLQAP